jgi:hypothetical protein
LKAAIAPPLVVLRAVIRRGGGVCPVALAEISRVAWLVNYHESLPGSAVCVPDGQDHLMICVNLLLLQAEIIIRTK